MRMRFEKGHISKTLAKTIWRIKEPNARLSLCTSTELLHHAAGGNNIPAVNQYKKPAEPSQRKRAMLCIIQQCLYLQESTQKTVKFSQMSLHSSYYIFSVFLV